MLQWSWDWIRPTESVHRRIPYNCLWSRCGVGTPAVSHGSLNLLCKPALSFASFVTLRHSTSGHPISPMSDWKKKGGMWKKGTVSFQILKFNDWVQVIIFVLSYFSTIWLYGAFWRKHVFYLLSSIRQIRYWRFVCPPEKHCSDALESPGLPQTARGIPAASLDGVSNTLFTARCLWSFSLALLPHPRFPVTPSGVAKGWEPQRHDVAETRWTAVLPHVKSAQVLSHVRPSGRARGFSI